MRKAYLAPVIALLLAACSQDNGTFPTYANYEPAAQEPLACMPNLDGQIDANELQAAVGVSVSYLVSPAGATRPVDLAGAMGSDGRIRWDWSARVADDRVAHLEATAIEGKWYAGSFPGAQFVAPFDAGHTIDSVYSHTDQALLLHGIASVEENGAAGQTLMAYQQPIELYRFPLKLGGTWIAAGKVENGMMRGLQYAGRDVYEVSIDGTGTLILPDITFSQVLRVRTKVTLEPVAGMSVTQLQTSFFFECFGEVARATSQTAETELNFATASEVRRLGLMP